MNELMNGQETKPDIMGSNPFIDVSWVTRKPGVWNTVV